MHPHHGPHGPHGHGHRFHGMQLPGSRARRGDVRAAIIALLQEQDMHGYQIIQEIAEKSGGAWNPSPGSIYPALQMLEDQGLIASDNVSGKRVFSLTEAGRTEAETLPDEAPWADVGGDTDPSRRLREAFHGLLGAVAQIGRTRDATQIDATTGILNDARKRIYQMLAGE